MAAHNQRHACWQPQAVGHLPCSISIGGSERAPTYAGQALQTLERVGHATVETLEKLPRQRDEMLGFCWREPDRSWARKEMKAREEVRRVRTESACEGLKCGSLARGIRHRARHALPRRVGERYILTSLKVAGKSTCTRFAQQR